jgi:hypothetical protein
LQAFEQLLLAANRFVEPFKHRLRYGRFNLLKDGLILLCEQLRS